MVHFILLRAVHAIIAMVIITVVVFLLVRASGDPAKMLLADHAPPEHLAEVRKLLYLDRPLSEQYWLWVSKAAVGDFGTSVKFQKPVSEIVFGRLPATIQLGLTAYALTLSGGLMIGVYAAVHRGTPLDAAARLLAVVGQAAPNFWLALVLILVFAVWLGWLPVAGRGEWSNLIMPAITLGWGPVAGLMRITRSSMIEVLGAEYVKLARIKGVSETRVIWRHAFKNAALPVLTYAALIFLNLMNGSVIVETVFAWPGVGRLVLESMINRDFQIVQAVVLLFSLWIILGNLVVDILYAYLNPRIRY